MAKAYYEWARKIGPKLLCFDCLGHAGNSDQLTVRRYELRKALTKNSLERVLLRLSLLFHCCFKWLTNYPTCCFLLFLSVCFLLCGRVLVGYCGGGWPAHKHFRLPLSLYVLDTLIVCSQFSSRCSSLYRIRFSSDSRLSRLDRSVLQFFLFVSGPP